MGMCSNPGKKRGIRGRSGISRKKCKRHQWHPKMNMLKLPSKSDNGKVFKKRVEFRRRFRRRKALNVKNVIPKLINLSNFIRIRQRDCSNTGRGERNSWGGGGGDFEKKNADIPNAISK